MARNTRARRLNGRKQKLIGDKPSIVHVLETCGMYEAAFPAGCRNYLCLEGGPGQEASHRAATGPGGRARADPLRGAQDRAQVRASSPQPMGPQDWARGGGEVPQHKVEPFSAHDGSAALSTFTSFDHHRRLSPERSRLLTPRLCTCSSSAWRPPWGSSCTCHHICLSFVTGSRFYSITSSGPRNFLSRGRPPSETAWR